MSRIIRSCAGCRRSPSRSDTAFCTGPVSAPTIRCGATTARDGSDWVTTSTRTFASTKGGVPFSCPSTSRRPCGPACIGWSARQTDGPRGPPPWGGRAPRWKPRTLESTKTSRRPWVLPPAREDQKREDEKHGSDDLERRAVSRPPDDQKCDADAKEGNGGCRAHALLLRGRQAYNQNVLGREIDVERRLVMSHGPRPQERKCHAGV